MESVSRTTGTERLCLGDMMVQEEEVNEEMKN
jgi:hypothetical protein